MKPLWELMKLEKEFTFSSVAAYDESFVAAAGDYNNPPAGGKKKGKSIWSCRFLRKGSSLRERMGSRLQLRMLLGYEGVEVINPEGGKEDAEEEASRGRWKQEIIAELVGMYFLIFAGCGSVVMNLVNEKVITNPGIAIVWGLAVMVLLVYSVGHICGAHFNSAVTISFATCKRHSVEQGRLKSKSTSETCRRPKSTDRDRSEKTNSSPARGDPLATKKRICVEDSRY
ncbi:hypothetical protein QQ045_025854 [Rhodiola kirilowii]